MSKYFIDTQFITRIGSDLKKFHSKGRVFNFRCPFCGDSKTDSRKCRGYLYTKKTEWFYRCFNCNKGVSFQNFLYEVNPALYREYKMALFKDNAPVCEEVKPDVEENIPQYDLDILKSNLIPVNKLPENHPALLYLEDRLIPKNRYREIYFVDDLMKVKDAFNSYDEVKFRKEPRIVLPVINKEKHIVGLITRSIDPDTKLRYVNLKADNDQPQLFGLHSVKEDRDIRVTEGAFDSFFVKNSIAASNLNLGGLTSLFPKEKLVLIFDNQPRHEEVVSVMKDAIDKGFRIVIWPPDIIGKDINDMVKNGITNIDNIIDNNTYTGIMARMKFSDWKKIDL